MNPLDKMLIAAGALVVSFLIGMGTMHHYIGERITTINAAYKVKLDEANNAKAAAEQRATNIEHGQAKAITDAVDTYKKERQDEKAHDDAVIAGLRSGAQRLRVSTTHAACGGPLPGPAASGPADPGPGDETLAGPVAARLAGRYADYNRIVEKLTMCQAVIQADRLQPAN